MASIEQCLARDVGPHNCPGCPGGRAASAAAFLEGDPFAECFVDCCNVKDQECREASRMTSRAEWQQLLRRLEEGGLVDPEDLPRLATCPLHEPEAFSVRIDKPIGDGLGANLRRGPSESLEVGSIDSGGALAAWNRANPLRAVRPGDRVLQLNGTTDQDKIPHLILSEGVLSLELEHPGADACALLRRLSRQLHGEGLARFDKAAESMRGALHSVGVSVAMRGLERLSQRELYTYQVLLGECEHIVAENLRWTLDHVRELRRTDAELRSEAFGGGAAPGPAGAEPAPWAETPEEFQWVQGPEIERRLRELRVPGAVLPPREVVVERTDWGLRRFRAVAVGSSEELEVLELPWEVAREYAGAAEDAMNQVEALKQLTVSHFFPDYLGCDLTSCRGAGLHFFPRARGVNLRSLVALAGPLREGQPLFHHWARQILLALRDYHYQCCQELREELTLAHVFACREGLQLQVRGAPFGDRRGALRDDMPDFGPANKWRNGFEPVEGRLISMFGAMLMELLCGRQAGGAAVPPALAGVSNGLQALVSQAVHARDSLDLRLRIAPSGGEPGAGRDEAVCSAVGLAGGMVGAGIDEFNDGEDYRLWWAEPVRPGSSAPVVLPNTEGSADEGLEGALEERWRAERGLNGAPEGAYRRGFLDRRPDGAALTLQMLLDHPLMRPSQHELPEIMDAWDEHARLYEANRAGRGALEAYLDGGLL